MNLRLFSVALLVSAVPLLTFAEGSTISLSRGDFAAAEKVSRNGETVVSVKLSKSGKAKFKKLNESSVGKNVHAEIAGVSTEFKVREPIAGDTLQMGPYSPNEAAKIISEINQK